MQKIEQKTLNRLADLSRFCGEVFDELEALRDKFESDAQIIIESMNGFQEEARGLMDDAAMTAEEYYDEKSERWQEGDRGSAYGEWRDRLREVADAIAEDLEAPEIRLPDRPDWVDSLGDQDFAYFEF